MAFQPAGLVAHPGVAGGVRLVEGVLGELLPVFPYLVEDLLRMPVCDTSLHELVLQGVEDIDHLLSHCLAEFVRLALGESGKLLGEQHDLLLIDGNSVSVIEILLHVRKVVLDRLLTEFPGHE